MKQSNEQRLYESVKSLRNYMDSVTNTPVAEDAASVGQAVGKAAGTVGGAIAAPARAGAELAQGVASNAGKWWDAAKQGVANAAQGVQNFAQGAVQGAQQGWAATDPAKLVGGGQQAAAKPGTTTAKPAAAKPDPAVMARQKELIAAGAKIKADGINGPATQAAEQQFGGQATVMAANAKDKAAAATQAPATDYSVAPAGTKLPNAAPAAAAPAAPAAGTPVTSGSGAPVVSGTGVPVTTATESVSFSQEDSLARIIQLSR